MGFSQGYAPIYVRKMHPSEAIVDSSAMFCKRQYLEFK